MHCRQSLYHLSRHGRMQVSAGHLKTEPLISRCLGSSWSKLSFKIHSDTQSSRNITNETTALVSHAWEALVYLLVQVGKGSVNLRCGRRVWLSERIVIILSAHKPPASPNQTISTVSSLHTPLEVLLSKKNAFSLQGPCLTYFSLYFWGSEVGLKTE